MKARKDQNKVEDSILNHIDLQDALKYNRFHDYLKRTKGYKDLFWSKEALISLIIACLTIYFLSEIMSSDTKEMLNVVATLIPVFIGGLLTVLALSLTGLAIVTSTLGDKFITIIIREDKLFSVLGILFNFYFSGFIIGVTLVSLTLTYFIINISKPFNFFCFYSMSFINSYLVFFSITYSIMLLGTCIRMFLVKYAIEKKFESK